MGSPRRRLLLGGVVALLLAAVAAGSSGSSSPHSLRYFDMALSEPGQGLPQFIAVGYVDDQPIARYDSRTRREVPAAPWMEEVTKDDPQYWERETQILQGNEAVFRANLGMLRSHFHQQNSTGLHVWQSMYGCEVGPDGQFRGGYDQRAYDGEDFVALDLQTRTWTACVPQALETKTRWETDLHDVPRRMHYLEEICVEWLQKYLGYGKETLQRTEAPTVRVSRQKGYSDWETLVCRVHGFYPKEIVVTWMKDGEDQKPETSSGGVVPNSDGTYHTWLSIEVDPKERRRYRCQVEHDGFKEPLDLAWEDPAPNLWLILGIVGGVLAAIALVWAAVAFYRRNRKEQVYKAAPVSVPA